MPKNLENIRNRFKKIDTKIGEKWPEENSAFLNSLLDSIDTTKQDANALGRSLLPDSVKSGIDKIDETFTNLNNEKAKFFENIAPLAYLKPNSKGFLSSLKNYANDPTYRSAANDFIFNKLKSNINHRDKFFKQNLKNIYNHILNGTINAVSYPLDLGNYLFKANKIFNGNKQNVTNNSLALSAVKGSNAAGFIYNMNKLRQGSSNLFKYILEGAKDGFKNSKGNIKKRTLAAVLGGLKGVLKQSKKIPKALMPIIGTNAVVQGANMAIESTAEKKINNFLNEYPNITRATKDLNRLNKSTKDITPSILLNLIDDENTVLDLYSLLKLSKLFAENKNANSLWGPGNYESNKYIKDLNSFLTVADYIEPNSKKDIYKYIHDYPIWDSDLIKNNAYDVYDQVKQNADLKFNARKFTTTAMKNFLNPGGSINSLIKDIYYRPNYLLNDKNKNYALTALEEMYKRLNKDK